MKKKLLVLLTVLTLMFAFVGCKSENNKSSTDKGKEVSSNIEDMTYDDLVKEAKGSTVTFYGWGGDEELNKWLDDYFAPIMKEKYDITMERVPMDIDQILSQLSGEVQAGKKDGDIDMIWINGENFKSAKENNMLYGPFVDKLSNYEKYIDTSSEDVLSDFGYPIEGYEAPYGKAQIVMLADTKVVKELPKSTDELLEFAKENKGKVTYPALPDFTGSAFVRNIIYDICGYEQFLDMEADKETVKKEIEPALEYLRTLNPYLWNEGKTFPESSTTVDNMFSDGELVLNMYYGAYYVYVNIDKENY